MRVHTCEHACVCIHSSSQGCLAGGCYTSAALVRTHTHNTCTPPHTQTTHACARGRQTNEWEGKASCEAHTRRGDASPARPLARTSARRLVAFSSSASFALAAPPPVPAEGWAGCKAPSCLLACASSCCRADTSCHARAHARTP